MNYKKLYKSQDDKMLCGVCGGIGEHFNIDPTLIRLVWVIFGITGAGLIAYFVSAVVIPDRPDL